MKGELVAGRYRLAEQIGEGASGTVYRATTEPGDETVAVKILRPSGGAKGPAAEAGRRFEREAVAAGKLEHPNLVGLRDFGALDDGRPFLVMDLVDGRSLATLIAEGRLPEPRGLAILAHVLRGLEHAHAAGVVHRDLKPADILLVDRDGDRDFAVVIDLGTAALMESAAEPLTRAGTALGAPAYMAPERLDPDRGPIDGRADLYSATCILFEMLSGKPPFGAAGDVSPDELIRRHAGADRPLLADAEVESTPGLDAIMARGLAVRPEDRFAGAAEYLRSVDACREGKLDPAEVGKPAAPTGKLAEPDPSKATTVFHGAPAPDAPAAASETPAAEPASAGASRRRWRFAFIGAGAAVVAVVVGAVGARGCRSGVDPTEGLAEAWQAEGLVPGDFEPVDGEIYGGGTCHKGHVSQGDVVVDVVVCRHPSEEAALEARKIGLESMDGKVTRSAIPGGNRLLVAGGDRRSDPKRTMSKVTRAFKHAASGTKKKPKRIESADWKNASKAPTD